MTYRIRVSLLLLGCLAVLALLALMLLYIAVRHEPEFYRRALEIPAENLEKGSDRMLQQAAAIESAINNRRRWEARITAEEINGWLAVDLPKNHPRLLPPMLGKPRVAIDENGLTVACLYRQDGAKTVLSLTVKPYLAESNAVALRIVHARAGILPAPLRGVLDRITEAARDMGLSPRWRTKGDDPVVIFSLPDDQRDRWTFRLDTLRLEEGAIHLTGSAEKRTAEQ